MQVGDFSGPLDLLMQLIHAKRMEITDVALAAVTDEFIAHTERLGEDADLDDITGFLVIAATLLSLKTARLLPRPEGEGIDEDLLDARDLLFARLLQYRAYKEVAAAFIALERQAAKYYPREVSLEEQFEALSPPVQLGVDVHGFVEIAVAAFRPKPQAVVGTGHLHLPQVSVPEQAGVVLESLHAAGAGTWLSFRTLTHSCNRSIEVIGRFLAVLELYRAQAVEVEQADPFADFQVSWTGKHVDAAVLAAGEWE